MLDSWGVFPALVAGRYLLTFTFLPEALKYDHQLTTPSNSYASLQEGIYLFENGINPYSGSVFHHSPLLLSLFTTILPKSRVYSASFWTLCDALGAWALYSIYRARQRVNTTPRDGIISALYLLNPYLFLPSLALSTSSLQNTMVLLSIMFASQRKVSPALLCFAFTLHLSLSTIVLLLPLLLLLVSNPVSQLASPRKFSSDIKQVVPLIGEFLLYFLVLCLASTMVTGTLAWIPQTWGISLSLPDLTPNPGLWWYFFTEMFDHFRPFFLMVFSVHLIIYIAPICIKFQHDPLYATFLLVGILGTFQPYPTLSDVGLFLSMTAIFPETFPHLRCPIVTSLLHLHAALLMPLFHYLWIEQGTGNANFYYATTLVFACANGCALLDSIWAGMRIAIGPESEKHAVVQE